MTIEEMRQAAETASRAANWSQAASLWEAVYQRQQTAATNLQLVTALIHDEKYAAASSYAAEFANDYQITAERATLYLTALLKSHQFVQAAIWRQLRVNDPEWQSEADIRLKTAETAAERTMQATLTTTMRQFYHLSDQPVVEQPERLQAAQRLTTAKYVTAAKFLLVDPFLNQLSRVEVLATLRAMGVTDEVQFQWFDDRRLKLVPAKLPNLGTDPTSRTVQTRLRDTVGQTDASLYENLTALLSLQLMFLYPQPELAITDPRGWVRLLVATQTGQLAPDLPADQQSMLAVQEKVQQLSLELQA